MDLVQEAVVVCSSVLAIALAGCRPGYRASYAFDLRGSDPASVRVSAVFEDLDAGTLTLSGLLGDRLLGVSNVEAKGADRRSISISPRPAVLGAGNSGPRFTRYALDVARRGRVEVCYVVQPTAFRLPNGSTELVHFGLVAETGCALSLAHLALVPDVPLSKVQVSVAVPEDWRIAVALPVSMVDPQVDSWWKHALVAGPYLEGSRQLLPWLSLSAPAGTPAFVPDAVTALARELETWLGPPRAPLRVVGLPASDDGLTTELPPTPEVVSVDLRDGDPGSLRRLSRALVPCWLGRAPVEVEMDTAPEAWFMLGLCEYLGLLLPARTGLVRRAAEVGLENTWIREQGLRNVDLLACTDLSSQAQLARRMAASVLVHELDRTLEPHGGLAGALRDFTGSGYPRFDPGDPRAPLFGVFLQEKLPPGARELWFEPRWALDLGAQPIEREPRTLVQRILTIAFTADTEGYLETCGCKLSQEGGLARRAAALNTLRKEDPNLLVLDIGNFAPVQLSLPRLHPLVEEEFGLYIRLMKAMGYEAASVGPDELYSGTPLLRADLGRIGFPLVGCGIRIGQQEPYLRSTVLEREGLRIGFLGCSEILEHGPLREAQEHNMTGVAFPCLPSDVRRSIGDLRCKVDLVVVGGHLSPSGLRSLADPDLRVDLVLLGGYPGYPALKGGAVGFVGETAVAIDQVANHGLNRLTLFLSGENRIVAAQLENVRLPRNAPVDAEVQATLDTFFRELGQRPELAMGLQPLFGWDDWHRDDYGGAHTCAPCHTSESQQWRTTRHATALETLVEVRRDRHPKCVRCHVLGLGVDSGYKLSEPDPRLAGVQCEACHGAGGSHVRSPSRSNIRRTPDRRVCLECHDAEHSEEFEARFDRAWGLVVHR